MNIKLMETLFMFAGGVGMFLYGMGMMADGLQKTTGEKMKSWIAALTKNKFLSISLGALITAVIQSSSATTVMVVGFVNAGVMTLNQSVGIIMGSNIGTTITAWIVSMGEWSQMLKPEFIAPILIAIGSFSILFSKSERQKNLSEILIGFGLLFIGLSFMSSTISEYSSHPLFKQAFITLGKNPLLAILVGVVVTGIIQSSSASVGILQALALSGLISWSSAVFITLGQNIGTCVTSIISTVGASTNAKRASAIHLLFNTVGAVIFGIIFFVLFKLNPVWANANINTVQISLFHTVFNISNTLILLPFSNQLVKLSTLIFKEYDEEEVDEIFAHLDTRFITSAVVALDTTKQEIIKMAKLALETLELSLDSLFDQDKSKIRMVEDQEKVLNKYTTHLHVYLAQANKLSLTQNQIDETINLFNIINDLERVGDHADNIAELALLRIDDNLRFSQDAKAQLNLIANKSTESIKDVIKLLETNDLKLVERISINEDKIDLLEQTLRNDHLKRLSENKCDVESGIIFVEVIRNLERVSDHALNIAETYL